MKFTVFEPGSVIRSSELLMVFFHHFWHMLVWFFKILPSRSISIYYW